MFNSLHELENRFGIKAINDENKKQLESFERACYVYSNGGIEKTIKRAIELNVYNGDIADGISKAEFEVLLSKVIDVEPRCIALSSIGRLRGLRMIEEFEFKQDEPVKVIISPQDVFSGIFDNISPMTVEDLIKEPHEDSTEDAILDTEDVVSEEVNVTIAENNAIEEISATDEVYIVKDVEDFVEITESDILSEGASTVDNDTTVCEDNTDADSEILCTVESEEATGNIEEIDIVDSVAEVVEFTEDIAEESVETIAENEVYEDVDVTESVDSAIEVDFAEDANEVEYHNEDVQSESVTEESNEDSEKSNIEEVSKFNKYDLVVYDYRGETHTGVLQGRDDCDNWNVTISESSTRLVKITEDCIKFIKRKSIESVEQLELIQVGDKVRYANDDGVHDGIIVYTNSILRTSIIARGDVLGRREVVLYNNILKNESNVTYGTLDDMIECSENEVIIIKTNSAEDRIIGVATNKYYAIQIMKAYLANYVMGAGETFITTKQVLNCYKGNFIR